MTLQFEFQSLYSSWCSRRSSQIWFLYNLHRWLCFYLIHYHWYCLVHYYWYFNLCLHIFLFRLQYSPASTLSSCLMSSLCEFCSSSFISSLSFTFFRHNPLLPANNWDVITLLTCFQTWEFLFYGLLTGISVTFLLVMGSPDFKSRTTHPSWFLKFTSINFSWLLGIGFLWII